MQNNKIVILGHGEMGHAFAYLLRRQPRLVIWTRAAEATGAPRLEELVQQAALVIFCLPVVAHAAVAQRLVKALPAAAICLTIAKGLDESGQPALTIMQQWLPTQRHVLIYGPMIAEEIRAGRPAFAQFGGLDKQAVQAIGSLFANTNLYLQTTRDMIGISWAVILKNVYAILFGVADQLGLGDNMRGFLMTQSLAELADIVQRKGGEAQSAFGLAGLGDLTTTATSEGSHHHGLGRCLARNDCEVISGEGVHTIKMAIKYNLLPLDNYPLFALCRDILAAPHRSRELFENYLVQYAQSCRT